MPKAIPAAVLAVLLAGPLAAQDVQWRHDYAAARKEATDTGKPLLLDFGSENCIWCQRLDASTFRAPNVVALLNEQFVPVKIDGNREERITQMMNVSGFPTLVLASADGKVLGRKDGYIDAGGMVAMLGQALSRVKSAAPSPPPQSPVAATPPAPRSHWADELALAREDYEAGRVLTCLERCERVRVEAAGTAEAAEAAKLRTKIAVEPTAWRRVCDQITARLDALHDTFDEGLRLGK